VERVKGGERDREAGVASNTIDLAAYLEQSIKGSKPAAEKTGKPSAKKAAKKTAKKAAKKSA
jgi:non-homologous end joining protein Ku